MPINLSFLPDEVIAKGVQPANVGTLPDSFFAGQEQYQKQALQNLFAGGFPRDVNGDIDWAKAGEMVLQAQGAPGLGAATAAAKFGLLSNRLKNAPTVPANPGEDPADTPGPQSNLVPSIQRPAGQAVVDNTPFGTPGRPNMNLTSGDITGIDYGPVTGRATGFAPEPTDSGILPTSARARQFNPDELTQLAQADVPGPNEPARRTIPLGGVDASGRPLPPTTTYQTQPAQPVSPQDSTGDLGRVPGSTTTPGGLKATEQNARRYEKAGSDLLDQAQTLDLLEPGSGADARARGQKYLDTAKQLRDSMLKNNELTPEGKAARDAGISTLEYNRRQEAAKLDVKDFYDQQKAINSAAQNAEVGLQKVQFGKQLTQQPGFYSGPWNEYNTAFQQFRNVFGTPGAALPSEAFNKVTNDLLQEQIKAMGTSGVGRVLQSEVAIMRQAIASMGITDVSNRALLELLSRTYRKSSEIANATANLPPNSRQLNQVILGYLRSHPMFSKEELANPRLLGAKEPPPESGNWSNAQKLQWAAQNGLQPGDPVMFNGHVVKLPMSP